MEGLAFVLFYVTLIGTIGSIGLIIYSLIKKDFKYRPKKLAKILIIFIVAFIGSTAFYGSVESTETKAKFEASQKAKAEEKAQKELLEQQKKAEEEKLKEEEQANKELETSTEVTKEIPTGDRFTITSESNTTAAVDELTLRAKENSKDSTDLEIKEAVKFINDNYNKYWTDNSIMEKTMYYGALLEYSNKNNDIKSLGVDAVQVVKYIYRKIEKVEDSSTQANLRQIQKSLDKIPDEYKK